MPPGRQTSRTRERGNIAAAIGLAAAAAGADTKSADAEIALIWRSPDFQGQPLTLAARDLDPVPVLTPLLRDGLVSEGTPR